MLSIATWSAYLNLWLALKLIANAKDVILEHRSLFPVTCSWLSPHSQSNSSFANICFNISPSFFHIHA